MKIHILGIKRGDKITALVISTIFLLFYTFNQSISIYGGDGGDLVTAAYVRGIPHPPGYPLYTFIAWILTKIPFFTVAWRVSLLSSIPQALSLGILYLIIRKFCQSKISSLIAVFTLGFSYLYWLYASVPEVFALNIFFGILIFYLLFLYRENGKLKYLFWSSFIFGLSLTHHHTILFLVPGFLYLVYPQIKKINFNTKILLKIIGLFFLGLIPYVYVIWAANGHPPVNWENPQNFSGFWRLLTRAVYGTFTSNKSFNINPSDRLFQLKLMLDTYEVDFNRIGLLLIFIGIITQFVKDRKKFWQIFIPYIFIGPIFLFYASFPYDLNFYLGTSERFLLLSSVFVMIWLAIGIRQIGIIFIFILNKIISKKYLFSFVELIFILLPVILLLTNILKILPLRNDLTAEKYGQDILNSTPDNALLFLSQDTPIFNSLYVYYTSGGQKANRNIKIIQFGAVSFSFYRHVLNYSYPELNVQFGGEMGFNKIVTDYFEKYPILSELKFDVPKDYFWSPYGLLFRLEKRTENICSGDDFVKENERLFASYQDPKNGALKNYTHVLLSDVLRLYSNSRTNVGLVLTNNKVYPLAEKYFQEAIDLQPGNIQNYLFLSDVLAVQLKCNEALKILKIINNKFPNFPSTDKYMTDLYSQCFKDDTEAKKYQDIYERKIKQFDVKLQEY